MILMAWGGGGSLFCVSSSYHYSFLTWSVTVLTYRHELGMNYNFIRPDLIVGSCLQVILVPKFNNVDQVCHFSCDHMIVVFSTLPIARLLKMLTSFVVLEWKRFFACSRIQTWSIQNNFLIKVPFELMIK